MEPSKRAACIAIKTFDPETIAICCEVGKTLLTSGYELIVEPGSPFIPVGHHITKDGPIKSFNNLHPSIAHYELTKRIVDFSGVHISKSKPLVRKVTAVLTADLSAFWIKTKDGKTDEHLYKLMKLAKEHSPSAYDIKNLKEFDRIIRLGF